MITHEELLRCLEDDLGIDVSGVGTETPLFSSGLVDSFSLVSLIALIEQRCGFRLAPSDVNLDNLDSTGRIVAFVARATAG